jgi:hypothetical protein
MDVVTEYRWERVPTVTAERARRTKEKREITQAKYESSEKAKRTRQRYEETHRGRQTRKDEDKRLRRPFIVWDGEQPRDTGYSLFGNSEGMEICHPHLSTKECLELIIDTELEFPDAIHVGYGFNLDVSWILKDLPWRALNRLKRYNRCLWNGYQIEHIPHKWFTVKYGTIRAQIFDIHSFFMGKLPDALEDWKIGPWGNSQTRQEITKSTAVCTETKNPISGLLPPESARPPITVPSITAISSMSESDIVETFKKLRSDFLWKDIESIAVYMRLELKYTKQLMEALREAMLAAGYLPTSWHGPGALATMALKRHHVFKAMAKTPPDVQRAARCAFFGGRFSQHMCGHIQRPVYFADRNSAYPYACTFLPNLARGKWRFVTSPGGIRESVLTGKFALYRIQYHHRGMGWKDGVPVIGRETLDQSYRIYPLPKRTANGCIEFPPRVTGWYWTPEAKLVLDDKSASFIAAWVFDEEDESDRPFAWITEYYRRRQLLKRTGQASEKTFKLILNAIFGQCARRTGWDRKNHCAPRSHQLEWAGYITSHCRAALYEMAIATGEENVVSIDTDGLLSLAPIPVEANGDGLGEWKTDTYDNAIVWQSGMYALRKGGGWEKAKTRGIARAAYSPDDLVLAVEQGTRTLKLRQNKFIGYGLALNGQYDRNNTWIEEPYEFVMGGSGYRYHDEKRCKTRCMGTIHRVKLNTFMFLRMDVDPESKPHFLPWMDNSDEMMEQVKKIDDLMLFDMWDQEEWRPDHDMSAVV